MKECIKMIQASSLELGLLGQIVFLVSYKVFIQILKGELILHLDKVNSSVLTYDFD